MDKKRVLNIFLFIVILLIGAYFTMADQGALTVAGINITAPLNYSNITTAGIYTFSISISTTEINISNWSLIDIYNSGLFYNFAFNNTVGNGTNATKATNDTSLWNVPDGVYNLTVNVSNYSSYIASVSSELVKAFNITLDRYPPFALVNESQEYASGAGNNVTAIVQATDAAAGASSVTNATNGTALMNNATVRFSFSVNDGVKSKPFSCSVIVDSITRNTSTNAVINSTRTTLDTYGLNYGWHYWNLSCTDQAAHTNTSIIKTRGFFVNDTLAPYGIFRAGNNGNNMTVHSTTVSSITNETVNISNGGAVTNNATIMFSYIVFDNINSTISCNVSVDNVVKNTSRTVYNGTREYVNVTGLQAGWHAYNLTCCDDAANTNYSTATFFGGIGNKSFFVNDTIKPTTPTLTLSSSTATRPNSITLACASSDNIDSSLTYTYSYKHQTLDSSYSATTATFTPADAGKYDIKCNANDDLSNAQESSVSVLTVSMPTTNSGTGGSSGGSSGGTALPTIEANIPAGQSKEVGNLDTSASAAVTMSSGSTATFSVAGASHSAVIKSITETSVVVTISSDPIDVELTVGETKEVDVDADGKNDLSVTLDSITSGVANLKFKSLAVTTTTTEPTTPTTPSTTETGTSLTWLWIVLAIVIIGAGVYFFVMKKK